MFDGLLNNLVSIIFTLVGNLVNTFMTPFINLVLNVVPDAQTHYTNISIFFQQASIYVTCIYRWFLFTKEMFQVLFVYWFARFSIYVISAGVRTILRFWNTFKP